VSWLIDERLHNAEVPKVSKFSKAQKRAFARFMGSAWNNHDATQHALARALEIVPPTASLDDLKWVYWSDSVLASQLMERLVTMTEKGVLDERQDKEHGHQLRLGI
jgi:hypothetical protein